MITLRRSSRCCASTPAVYDAVVAGTPDERSASR
jgi:hypothetical protein